ncbi:hypothetical protein [Streptomyces sp. OM5714]|uniref:hypothetical protein n=1 Tax=Streptomyces sp. OM5714 TaxID=2602736 RepID=UPI001969E44D|nr:hypothetical protein [Streptomyces sp. OM5714]
MKRRSVSRLGDEGFMDQYIKALYSPQDNGQPALVSYGQLPAKGRKDAPDWEKRARQRMYDLLHPEYVASSEEVDALQYAGIPLKERVPGDPRQGLHIAPGVPRESELNAALASRESARAIGRLYSPQDNGQPALVSYGQLPTYRRKGAPAWENKARQRMYDLLRPENKASSEEVDVLLDSEIPLKERVPGDYESGLHIDPGVLRESEQNAVQTSRESSQAIARLYRQQDNGQPPLVSYGQLPTYRRKGAPAWENKARQRMHNLLDPKNKASSEEVDALLDAGIPLKARQGDSRRGFHIDPGVSRESGRRRQGGAAQRSSVLRTGVAGPVYAQESGYASSADPSAGHPSAVGYREADFGPSAPTSSGHLGHGYAYGYPPLPDATPTDYYAGTISNNYDASTFYDPFQDPGQSAPAGTYSALPPQPLQPLQPLQSLQSLLHGAFLHHSATGKHLHPVRWNG